MPSRGWSCVPVAPLETVNIEPEVGLCVRSFGLLLLAQPAFSPPVG